MHCPACQKSLTPETDANGVTRAFCDCAGFRRPVIEILPPVEKTRPEIVNRQSSIKMEK